MRSESIEMKNENIELKGKGRIIVFILLLSLLLFTAIIFVHAFYQRDIYDMQYSEAESLFRLNDYDGAIEILETLQDHKDVKEFLEIVKTEKEYSEAVRLYKGKEYEQAIEKFSKIKDYKDCVEMIDKAKYKLALQCYSKKDYMAAKKLFVELGDYSDSKIYLTQIEIISIEQSKGFIYQVACGQLDKKNYKKALELFENIADYKDSSEKIEESKKSIRRQLATTISVGLHYSVAIKDSDKDDRNNKIICTDTHYKFDGWNDVISVSGFGTMVIGLNKDGSPRPNSSVLGRKSVPCMVI